MKKLLYYIYHFFYLALNWNPLLAIFISWHEAKRGPRYNINTIKRAELEKFTIAEGDISKSSPYEAVNYYILEDLLKNFRMFFPGEKSLVDVGSGKGRVLVVAAHFGFTQITGVDFAKELCKEAEKNIEKIKTKFPDVSFRIIWKNILNYQLGPDDKVFFLFNPFNKEILEKFVDNIELSVKKHPRPVYFIYASPKHKEVLVEKKFDIVYHVKKMKFLKGLIAVKMNTG